MNTSIEKAIVEEEMNVQERELSKVPPVEQKPLRTAPRSRTKGAENWNVKAAAELEEIATTETLIAETSRVSIASSKSSTGAIPKASRHKKKKKRQKGPPEPQEGSPFHYSPPRTPPAARQQVKISRNESISSNFVLNNRRLRRFIIPRLKRPGNNKRCKKKQHPWKQLESLLPLQQWSKHQDLYLDNAGLEEAWLLGTRGEAFDNFARGTIKIVVLLSHQNFLIFRIIFVLIKVSSSVICLYV